MAASNTKFDHAPEPDLSNRQLGDYQVGRRLGRGGMADVYLAEQISLRRRVALKVLPMAGTLAPEALARFQVEAQAAGALRHPNIVPVFAIGCDQGLHFYAMQYIIGRTLERIIDGLRRGATTPSNTENPSSSDPTWKISQR